MIIKNSLIVLTSEFGSIPFDLIGRGLEASVLVLDQGSNPFKQIQRRLFELGSVEAIHLFCHGSPGVLSLSGFDLTLASLQDQIETLRSFRAVISNEADILIYGCSVAASEDGKRLLSELSLATGANVAASLDPTGTRAFGGNWELEFQIGTVDTETLALSDEANVWLSSSKNTVTGDAAGNTLSGVQGRVSFITGGGGNDIITGKNRADVAVYSGNKSDYTITTSLAGVVTVTHKNNGSDGVDTLHGINVFQFADGLHFEAPAANRVRMQGTNTTYVVSNSDYVTGSNSVAEQFVVQPQTSAYVAAGNNDVIDIAGAITDYSYRANGSILQIIDSSGSYTTFANIGGSTNSPVKLRTASGSTPVTLGVENGAVVMKFGTQIVGSTAFSNNPTAAITNSDDRSSNAGLALLSDQTVNELAIYSLTFGSSVFQEGGHIDAVLSPLPVSGAEFSWQRSIDNSSWTNISGISNTSFTISSDQSEVGKYLRLIVKVSDPAGRSTTLTSASYQIQNVNDPLTGNLTISGTARKGQTLNLVDELRDEDGIKNVSYQWKADGIDINGANSTSLLLTDAQVGKKISVVASVTDAFNNLENRTSLETVEVIAAITISQDSNASGTSGQDIFVVDASVQITNASISGFGQGDTLQILNLADTTGIGFNVPANIGDPILLTIGNSFVVFKDYGPIIIFGDPQFLQAFGQQALVYGLTLPTQNQSPTASNLSRAESYTEDTALNLIDIVVSDADSADITATLALSSATAGSLSVASSGSLTSSFNSSTGVWNASGALASVNALLVGLVFTPAANANGNFSITTSISDGVNSPITGSKPFTGTAINDAPILDPNYTPAPGFSIALNAPAPSGATGVLVSSLLGGVTDPDAGALQGMAIVGTNTAVGGANGTLFYSLNNGSSWTTFGSASSTAGVVSPTAALVLPATARLYFQPASGSTAATLSDLLSFRAWDQTSGAAGTKVNTDINGGTLAFSTATDTVALTLTAVTGTAPVLQTNPLDNVTNLDPTSNIVLNYDIAVTAAPGKYIRIVNDGGSGAVNTTYPTGAGFRGENTINTLSIPVNDTSQVTISGSRVLINPKSDLDLANKYHMEVDAGAFTSAAGLPTVAFDGTTALNFNTITPGRFDLSLAALSKKQNEQGTIVDSFKWLDIEGIGSPSSQSGSLLDLSGDGIAMVFRDYSARPSSAATGYDGIDSGSFNVSATGFGTDDLLYADSQSSESNDLLRTIVINRSTGPSTIQFAPDILTSSLGGFITVALVGSTSVQTFSNINDWQAKLGTSSPPFISG